MNNILRVCAVMAFLASTSFSQAQMANGSFVPNFEAEDINGNTHNLYDYLSQGYKVIIDVSATWCGPCWTYHTSGALEDVWETYGPDGTDDVIVIFVEGDDSTTAADLEGTGGATQGNWIEGTGYPIIDDAGWIANLLEIAYYPTVYTICPDGRIYETGQLETAEHWGFMEDMTCSAATSDVAVSAYTGTTAACEAPFNASIELTNVGTEELTSATVVMMGCDDCPVEQTWSGSLGWWESAVMDFGLVNAESDTDLEFVIDADDDNTENNDWQASVAVGAVEATTWWYVDVTTDCWPAETTWSVIDENGDEVMTGGPYEEGLTEYNHGFGLPATGCYTFVFRDAYGDGLNGSAYPSCGVDGNAMAWTEAGTVWSTDGSVQFSMEQANANASTVTVEEQVFEQSLSVYPNPVRDNATVAFNLINAEDVTVEVFSLQGQRVLNEDFGTVLSGEHRFDLDFGGLTAGMYLVNITAGEVVMTQRVTVAK